MHNFKEGDKVKVVSERFIVDTPDEQSTTKSKVKTKKKEYKLAKVIYVDPDKVTVVYLNEQGKPLYPECFSGADLKVISKV